MKWPKKDRKRNDKRKEKFELKSVTKYIWPTVNDRFFTSLIVAFL